MFKQRQLYQLAGAACDVGNSRFPVGCSYSFAECTTASGKEHYK